MLKNDGMRPIVRHQPTFAIRMAIGVTMLVIRKVPRLRFYGQRLLQNPIVRTISVQRIMETGAVADIQEIKSEHAVSICEHCNYRYVNLGASRRSNCHAWHNILFSVGAGTLWRNSTP